MRESTEEAALVCGECGWILAGLPRAAAREVPRCLACGAGTPYVEPVAAGVRLTRWPSEAPGWSVYSSPALDKRLVMLESQN